MIMESLSTLTSSDNNCPTSPITSSHVVLISPSLLSPENSSKDDPTSSTSSTRNTSKDDQAMGECLSHQDSKPDLMHPRSALRNPSLRPEKDLSRRVSFNERVSIRQVPSFDNHPVQWGVQSRFGCNKICLGWTCWVIGLISFVMLIIWVAYYFVFRPDKKHGMKYPSL
ncbi:hypothetical protein LIER_30359 [Lithospermum erythrorhizon]|uniref:Uncharacterized protein n=1 Tax=Lithospermum erythrorhizon TaxID=34254 RepID=A0AAV3RME4_LITER